MPRVEVLQVLTSTNFLSIENVSTAVNGSHVTSLHFLSIVEMAVANGPSDLDTIICNCLIFTLLNDAVTTVEVTQRRMKWKWMVSRWRFERTGDLGLRQGTIPAFACKNRENSRRTWGKNAGIVRMKYELVIFQLQNLSVTGISSWRILSAENVWKYNDPSVIT
jgi:hypothetical protein